MVRLQVRRRRRQLPQPLGQHLEQGRGETSASGLRVESIAETAQPLVQTWALQLPIGWLFLESPFAMLESG